MEQSKRIEALRDTIAAREAEINAQLAALETTLLETNLQIEGYALRGVEPRFGLALQWKEHEGEWFLSIRHKSNSWRWSEAKLEDRTYALELIGPLAQKLVDRATLCATQIGATLPDEERP